MAWWSIIIIVALVIALIAIAVATFFLEESNKKKQSSNIIYPFSGMLTPPSPPWTVNSNNISVGAGATPEAGLSLLGSKGGSSHTEPQIQCPAGTKINIIGAYIQVTDPYGECSTSADSMLQMTCGSGVDASVAAGCSGDQDCGAGLQCNTSLGLCVPAQCTKNSDCVTGSTLTKACSDNLGKTCSVGTDCGAGMACSQGKCEVDPGSGTCMACVDGYCASMPTCNFVQDGLNTTCSPVYNGEHKYRCRPRDASAYLAKWCDGKSECLGANDVWLPNSPGGAFGPLPCAISARSGDPNYSTLPVVTGWGGGTPDNANNDVTATFNQGYRVAGIFTCVPDS
jgi:hypothetical protein